MTDKGKEIATGEQMWVHVDMKAGRTTPFKLPLKDNITALAAAHAHLPLPVGAGRLLVEVKGNLPMPLRSELADDCW